MTVEKNKMPASEKIPEPIERVIEAVSPENIPRPDPSLMTTRQLQREVFALRELLEVKLGSNQQAGELNRAVLETRLDGMDKAIKLLQDTADKFPARIDEKIAALKEVHDQKFTALTDTHSEKFSSIQTQFKERDVRTEQSSKDSKVAVDAALQAAKEAVGEQNKSSALAIAKSETATTKQIDTLGTLIQTMTKSADEKIADVKDRLTRIEGRGEGQDKTHVSTISSSNMMAGWVMAGVMLLVALGSLAVVLLHNGAAK
jgi:hypothetical protein